MSHHSTRRTNSSQVFLRSSERMQKTARGPTTLANRLSNQGSDNLVFSLFVIIIRASIIERVALPASRFLRCRRHVGAFGATECRRFAVRGKPDP